MVAVYIFSLHNVYDNCSVYFILSYWLITRTIAEKLYIVNEAAKNSKPKKIKLPNNSIFSRVQFQAY